MLQDAEADIGHAYVAASPVLAASRATSNSSGY